MNEEKKRYKMIHNLNERLESELERNEFYHKNEEYQIRMNIDSKSNIKYPPHPYTRIYISNTIMTILSVIII